jgi:hypothetical protein
MAKRKVTRKKTSRRRRSSVGAINPGNLITTIAGVAVGAAAAGFITSKILGKQSDVVKALAAVGLGVLTPTFVKSDIGRAAGNGMIAVGTISLLRKTGLVSGLGEDGVEVTMGELPVIGEDVMDGDDVMAGDDMPVMSGFDDMDN